MNQSGRPSRWRPSTGPVKLAKSDGQFSGSNKFKPVDKRSGFTAGTCLAAGSLERPNDRQLNCNQKCYGANGGSYGYDGTEWNLGSACTMYNMICVKNDYDTNTSTTVANCCNGTTPQKDCDSSLCPASQVCRDKMISICDKPEAFGTEQCKKWLEYSGNEDMKDKHLSKYCTAEMLESGRCRDFALNPESHGLMDAEVIRWCTPGQIKNPEVVSAKLAEFTRWQTQGAAQPAWFVQDYPMYYSKYPSTYTNDQRWKAYYQEWLRQMQQAINMLGLAYVQNPQVTYRDNSKDKICSCIASPLTKLGAANAPPSCFDTVCQAGGYRTGTMVDISRRCPSYTDCRASVAAIAGGTNERVNIQQICGDSPTPGVVTNAGSVVPAGSTTPVTGATSGVKDDKQLLLDDEARAAAAKPGTSGTPPIAPTTTGATPGLADQLNKPFMPGQFGDMSIASVGILFFALIILSAILWRQWANRQSQEFARQLQAEQIQAAQNLQATSPAAMLVQTAVQEQMNNLPRVGATATAR